jgi:MFS family permease
MLTALTLFGGMLLGSVLGQITFNALPGHSSIKPSAVHITLSVIPALTGLFIGSALWGVLIGRLGQATDRRRMAIAGMLGFAPSTIGLGLVLNALEPVAVEHLGAHIPIHRLFTLLFVPSVFVIAGLSAWVIGHGLRNTSLALSNLHLILRAL